MTDKEATNEVVLFFGEDGEIVHEVRFADFEAMIEQTAKLEAFAASVAKAAFATVASGLHVTGIVFFTVTVDENGLVDPDFNLPLAYLLQNAGDGPDLGAGPIRMACRSQCSVPWHALTLWQPEGEGDAHPAQAVQRTIWRNRLGLKLIGDKPWAPEGAGDSADGIGLDFVEALGERVDSTFDDQGRVSLQQLIKHYNEQIESLRDKHRRELGDQQQTYLSQVRTCRDEIHRLKVELRHEQNRNARLQRILRGEVDGH